MSQGMFGAIPQLQALQAQVQQLQNQVNGVAASLRKDLVTVASAAHLRSRRDGAVRSLDGVSPEDVARGGGSLWKAAQSGIVRLEDIPGRRRPFTYLVEIPVGANVTSQLFQSFTVDQNGPFVATRRWLAFLSQYSFTYTDPATGTATNFLGRSNGRFRPVSSAFDFNDSQQAFGDATNTAVDNFNGAAVAATAVYGAASNISGFRTMELDAYIEIRNSGSGMPRQNKALPSAFWSSALGAGVELGSLDFFERGEVVEVYLQPTHPQNAAYGNVSDATVFTGSTGYPFVEGQFDAHEGIATPDGAVGVAQGSPTFLAADPITRLPEGIAIVALEGYRIDQPPGIPAGVQL